MKYEDLFTAIDSLIALGLPGNVTRQRHATRALLRYPDQRRHIFIERYNREEVDTVHAHDADLVIGWVTRSMRAEGYYKALIEIGDATPSENGRAYEVLFFQPSNPYGYPYCYDGEELGATLEAARAVLERRRELIEERERYRHEAKPDSSSLSL